MSEQLSQGPDAYAEAELARDAAEAFQARLASHVTYAENGDCQITFKLREEDLPRILERASLGSLWLVALVKLDNDAPVVPSYLNDALRVQRHSIMICRDTRFMIWATEQLGLDPADCDLYELERNARQLIYDTCEITSRSALKTNAEARRKFNLMTRRFHEAIGQSRFLPRNQREEG